MGGGLKAEKETREAKLLFKSRSEKRGNNGSIRNKKRMPVYKYTCQMKPKGKGEEKGFSCGIRYRLKKKERKVEKPPAKKISIKKG